MKRPAIYLLIYTGLLFTTFLSCDKESTTEPEPESIVYDASGLWTFIFTQTKIVGGDYIECGSNPDSTTII